VGQRRRGGRDYESAITAYERFLDLQPNAANAEQIQEQIDALKAVTGAADAGGLPGASDGGSEND
jgi:regulator of sirC expression with transglutaminase-like and TPR domain